MILNFRLKLFVNDNYSCIDYQLSEIEAEKLINEVGMDFLSIHIPNNNDSIRLELDVVFEDVEMIYKIISLISDMFPNSLKSFLKLLSSVLLNPIICVSFFLSFFIFKTYFNIYTLHSNF